MHDCYYCYVATLIVRSCCNELLSYWSPGSLVLQRALGTEGPSSWELCGHMWVQLVTTRTGILASQRQPYLTPYLSSAGSMLPYLTGDSIDGVYEGFCGGSGTPYQGRPGQTTTSRQIPGCTSLPAMMLHVNCIPGSVDQSLC